MGTSLQEGGRKDERKDESFCRQILLPSAPHISSFFYCCCTSPATGTNPGLNGSMIKDNVCECVFSCVCVCVCVCVWRGECFLLS